MTKQLHHPIFIGPFADYLHRFLGQKRAIGYKYVIESWELGEFDRYMLAYYPNATTLELDMINDWASHRPNEIGNKSSNNRFTVMRQFASFLLGCGCYADMPDSCKRRIHAFTPYIFTHHQISQMFAVLDSWSKEKRTSPVFKILPLLFRTLYCCGLRISEALNLTVGKVDLEKGNLLITDSKYGKERLLPMSSTLLTLYCGYFGIFKKHDTKDEFLFCINGKTAISRRTIYTHFRKLLWECGISHNGQGPRIHDFRHTFAVHSLVNWTRQGIDINVALPYLSTYLGHSNLSSTSQYLRLTAEVFPEILQQVEDHFQTAGGAE
jgi:site-specific recombinase XerD